jgi:hypothetical protein
MNRLRRLFLGLILTGVAITSPALTERELGLPARAIRSLGDFYKTSYQRDDFYGMAVATHYLTAAGLRNAALMGPDRQIVVLVPNAAFAEALSGYVAQRAALGFSVLIHDLEDELGTSTYTPHDVRGLLQSHYRTGGLRYLIIVGDEDLVPMLPSYAPYGHDFTYTDYYYADLEGDWDVDGDGQYGEMTDDAIDFIPEFVNGRIPAATPEEAAAALERALWYRSHESRAKNRGILAAGTIQVTGDSALLQNFIKSFLQNSWYHGERFYDTDALELGPLVIPLGPEHTIADASLPDVWNAHPYSMVYDISHGSDNGITLFWRDEIPDLRLQFPSYFIAAACATSHPVPGWNFSEELLFEGGCAGVVGSSNLVSPGEGLRLASGVFAEVSFALSAVQPNQPLGKALNATKVIYYLLFVQNETDPYWREVMGQNLKGYQFYGDPEVPLRTVRSLFQGY